MHKHKTKYLLIPAILVALFGAGYYTIHHQSQSTKVPTVTSAPFIPDHRTKTTHCTAQYALPDHHCTPGAIISSVTKEQICTSGYSQSARDVPEALKKEVYAGYAVTHHNPGEYEVDHYISLELGGSNDIANLWPEAASPKPGFHEKDKVENYLHDKVCTGTITLNDAQRIIATDWIEVYQGIK